MSWVQNNNRSPDTFAVDSAASYGFVYAHGSVAFAKVAVLVADSLPACAHNAVSAKKIIVFSYFFQAFQCFAITVVIFLTGDRFPAGVVFCFSGSLRGGCLCLIEKYQW